MDRQKLYIESLAITLSLTTLCLTLISEQRLEVYVSLFAVGYFAITFLFRPRKRWIDLTGIGLFISFCYIVALQLLDIIL